jgi:hypothetical protein
MSTTTTTKQKKELTKELSQDELDSYQLRSEEIAKELNVSKVHPVVFINPTSFERSVCYLSEPNFPTKLAIMDKALMLGVYQAGEELMRACVVKEHSDSVTYSEHPSSDEYRMGVIDYCLKMINRYQNQFKKK